MDPKSCLASIAIRVAIVSPAARAAVLVGRGCKRQRAPRRSHGNRAANENTKGATAAIAITAITAIAAITLITAITGITALLFLLFVIALLVFVVLIVLSVLIAICC